MMVYVLGNAYLAAQRGREASDEFQKILQHPGVLCNDLLFTLSRLGLARAYAMQRDSAKAKAAYKDFLTLWKDADADIPVLEQAIYESRQSRVREAAIGVSLRRQGRGRLPTPLAARGGQLVKRRLGHPKMLD
jgi:hypothetical protein